MNSIIRRYPEEIFIRTFSQFAWKKPPLSRPVLGTIESVSLITQRDILSFYKKVYTTQNIIVTVVGNFDKRNYYNPSAIFSKISMNILAKKNTNTASFSFRY
jgi:hypothetical protein